MSKIHFCCDWSLKGEPLPHCWEHTVGSCHAPLALRADWQAQLRQCHEDLGFRHVRFHGLLGDDLSTAVRHQGSLLYSFHNVDLICDFLLALGMRPFVELSFMPSALASGDAAVFHYRGNVTPPRDLSEWAALVGKLAEHWIGRYGASEVRQWFFEVWNEPNLRSFWTGSQQDYFDLYRHTAGAIKAVDSELRVGGPATAKEEWIEEFLDFCEKNIVPVDFVSTHHYPNDVLWYEDQDTHTQLANSRRSILRDGILEARRRCRGWPLYYTEWNCSSNPRYPPQDEPYAAAFAVKSVMEAAGLVECYSFWTFTDIFEENYFPSVPFHGGFGLLNLHGVPKPTYRAFQLLHGLGTERLPVEGLHDTVDAWVVRRPRAADVLLCNHALPLQPIQTHEIQIQLSRVPRPHRAYVQRIDERHANAKRQWQALGEPEYLSRQQVEMLQDSSRLTKEPLPWRFENGTLDVELEIPSHAVAAVTVEFAGDC